MIFQTNDDFDLDKIADSGQCFRWEKTNAQTYRIIAADKCLYISVSGNGRFEVDCTDAEFTDYWFDYFDLRENYRHIRERIDAKEDPFLYQACEHEKGIRILRQDPWEILISFIISQNKNIPAIRRSIALLCEACGELKTDSRDLPYYAFPSPAALLALDGACLRKCSLGYRCGYVHAAAAAVAGSKSNRELLHNAIDVDGTDGVDNAEDAKGSIDLEVLKDANNDEAIHALTSLYGVGIKVASCVSLFGLHHLDAFPVDVWMKRILENEYPCGYPADKYSHYNGVYQQYMFAFYRRNYPDK